MAFPSSTFTMTFKVRRLNRNDTAVPAKALLGVLVDRGYTDVDVRVSDSFTLTEPSDYQDNLDAKAAAGSTGTASLTTKGK